MVKFKLKIDGKVKYSPNERSVFKALTGKPLSSSVLLDKVYGEDVPYNGRKIIIGVIASLRKKFAANKEPFKLVSGERSGPHPMEFWLEAK